MAAEYIVVTTTTDDRAIAEGIAERLVTSRLAACVQICGPITSRYMWQGACERSEEWMCTIKTRAACFDAVRRAIEALHSYDTPEILAVPAAAVAERYAAWIDVETSTTDS